MAVNDKPRFKDDLPSNMFWDNNPKRILLSKYKDHKGQDFIAIGMNYGVLVGKTIVQALGGHDIVCRIIATGGLIGLWDAVQALEVNVRLILREEIKMLEEAIALEKRLGFV